MSGKSRRQKEPAGKTSKSSRDSSSQPGKRVSFSEDAKRASAEADLTKSPLKPTSELGGKIKKLSPVTGAAESTDAKEAFERLLQEASVSMFVDDGDDIDAAGNIDDDKGKDFPPAKLDEMEGVLKRRALSDDMNDSIIVGNAKDTSVEVDDNDNDGNNDDDDDDDDAIPSWGSNKEERSPVTPTTRLESTAQDNSPRDVELVVGAATVVSPPVTPLASSSTVVSAMKIGSKEEDKGKPIVGKIASITPRVPSVTVSKATDKSAAVDEGPRIAETLSAAPAAAEIAGSEQGRAVSEASASASPSSRDILDAHLSSIADASSPTQAASPLSTGEATASAAELDDSVVFERDLVQENQQSLGHLMAQIELLKAQVEEVVADEVPSLRASQEGENALHRLEAVQDASPPAATASRHHQPHFHPDDPQHTQPTESSSHHEVDLTTKAHVREIMEHEESLRSAHHKEQQKMGTIFAHAYEKARARDKHHGVRAPYDADMNDSDGDQAPTEAEANISNLDMDTPSLAGIRPGGTGPEADTFTEAMGGEAAITTRPAYGTTGTALSAQESVQDDMAGIMQASVVLQQYRERLRAAETEFSKYLTGGRGIGESDEDDDEDDNGTSIARSAEDQAAAERAAKATSLGLQTFSYDVLEARVWQKHEELLLAKMLPAEAQLC